MYTDDLHNEMVNAEVLGLNTLSESQVNVPRLLHKELRDDFSFLALEWIEESVVLDPIKMANQLVKMHKTRANHFGFGETTFVGSVLQTNHWDKNWVSFWWEQRIEPLWGELKIHGDSYSHHAFIEVTVSMY